MDRDTTDFPPFVKFELKESFRRKIFSQFVKRVGEAEVDLFPDEFWRSAEEEFNSSRYEMIFGNVRGKILKTLEKSPLRAKEILDRNLDLSPYSIYHALIELKDYKLIQKKDTRWKIKKDYFNQLRVSDLAKIIDLRHNGFRRNNALSMKDLEMAAYLWPKYESVRDHEGIRSQSSSYGRWYQNQFALARAVKEWEKGAINIPQWALIAIADLADLDIEEREAISSYSLPPGVKITPSYKGRYKIPERMKERWKKLRDHEKTISEILVLEMLFDLNQPGRAYEIISRLKDFLGDVASIIKDLGIGDMTIHKRKDRPHYRSYLPKKVRENLNELRENVETSKIEKGIAFLVEKERTELIRKVKETWGDKGVNIISNLVLDKGVRDLDLVRASGVTPKEVRKILYELRDKAIITDIREETPELVEYYYYLNSEGIKKFLTVKRTVSTKKEEEFKYPFPEEFAYYQRRRIFSGVG